MTASRTYNGSSDLAQLTLAVLSAMPMTFAAWVYPTAGASAAGHIMGIYASASAHCWRLLINQSTTNLLTCNTTGATATTPASTVNTVTNSAWNHAACVFTSATSRKVVLNGDLANAGTDTTNSGTPTGLNRTTFGRRDNVSPNNVQFLLGNLGPCAIWSASLTDDELVALAKGDNPRSIRPASLVLCTPFPGSQSPLFDLYGNHLTLTGTSASVLGPPMALR